MIKFEPKGKGYIFWLARTNAELATKDNSVKVPEKLALQLIEKLKL